MTTQSIPQEALVRAIKSATQAVFETMLAQEAVAGDAYVDLTGPGPSQGVVAFIGLAGPWAGTGSFCCSAEAACRLSSAMLMTEYDAVSEDVLDAVAELTNMIVGNVKTALEEEIGAMWLSIPTVIFGRNFSTRTVGKTPWTVVPFMAGDDRIEVQVCLAQSLDNGTYRPGYTDPHLVRA